MNTSRTLGRRTFLEAAGALALGVGRRLYAQEGESPLIIDCHAHIYSEDEKKYPTIEKPYRPPPGKGTIAHLKQEMRDAGVRRVTAIQTSTFYRWDNRFTADASKEHKDFMVGVCTLNPDDPASPALLGRYAKEQNVRGMRSIPAASGRLRDPGVERLWRTAEDLGVVINVLTNRDQREEVEALVREHPKLRVVIDHCLNLKAGPELEPTLKDLAALARWPTVHAKLTFIPTGTAEDYPCKDLHDACRAVIRSFGPERCVWGSDFPCELWCPKVTYAQHLRIFTHELGLDEQTKRAVLGETARRLWFG